MRVLKESFLGRLFLQLKVILLFKKKFKGNFIFIRFFKTNFRLIYLNWPFSIISLAAVIIFLNFKLAAKHSWSFNRISPKYIMTICYSIFTHNILFLIVVINWNLIEIKMQGSCFAISWYRQNSFLTNPDKP